MRSQRPSQVDIESIHSSDPQKMATMKEAEHVDRRRKSSVSKIVKAKERRAEECEATKDVDLQMQRDREQREQERAAQRKREDEARQKRNATLRTKREDLRFKMMVEAEEKALEESRSQREVTFIFEFDANGNAMVHKVPGFDENEDESMTSTHDSMQTVTLTVDDGKRTQKKSKRKKKKKAKEDSDEDEEPCRIC